MKCYMTGKPCDYYKSEANKTMFVVSPFGFPFDYLYRDGGIIQKCRLRCGLEGASRSDQTMRLGSIMCQSICKEIIESQYLYADISMPNANVYYELGLAYALSRKIVVLRNADFENPYAGLFESEWKGKGMTYAEYRDVASLTTAVESLDIACPIHLKRDSRAPSKESPVPGGRSILIVENGNGGIGSLYERLLEETLKDFRFDEDLKKMLSPSEAKTFQESDWKLWKISTLRIGATAGLQEIVDRISQCDICIVDTTAYRGAGEPRINPYMYFCLGLAHGFEREVIPMTNTVQSTGTPFDVKGLWHIFFSKEEELKSGFSKIVQRISIEFHKERSNAPYRRIWDDFLADKQTLSVIYCGRPAGDGGQSDANYKNRGPRTNVDSWDTKAVSEVSFYLAQKYPTALIKPASPKTKVVGVAVKKVVQTAQQQLKEVYRNCIIIGSPDVNDYAEVVLSELYGVEPFKHRDLPSGEQKLEKGFIFQKSNMVADIRSAFFAKSDRQSGVVHREGVNFCGEDPAKLEGTTYGVLTIARHPFARDSDKSEGRVMVLSGFTGIATCGLMELIIESEPEAREDGDEIDAAFKQSLRRELETRFLAIFKRDLREPISVLIKFTYRTIKEAVVAGDNRRLVDAQVMFPI